MKNFLKNLVRTIFISFITVPVTIIGMMTGTKIFKDQIEPKLENLKNKKNNIEK